MSPMLRAGERTTTTYRRLARRRQRRSGLAQVFETIAALIPAMVFLIHLTVRSASAHPLDRPGSFEAVATEVREVEATKTLTVVPEPNSLTLAAVGGALLLYFRRKAGRNFSARTPIAFQPSRIATDVA